MPRSLRELALIAIACVVLALSSFLLSWQLLQLTDSLLLWCLLGLAALIACELLRRRWKHSWAAVAVQLGLTSTYVLAAVAIARAYV